MTEVAALPRQKILDANDLLDAIEEAEEDARAAETAKRKK